jgi:uncharacterized heparinase superfamily protein
VGESGRDGTDAGGVERPFKRELYKNALFLYNHVEHDVGGNHLIENGAALVSAGIAFDEVRWIDDGTAVLSTAADEQFLADGFHFERSPMYHVIALTRYLTVCDLLERSGRSVPPSLRSVAERGAAFLSFLRPPDGRIPLLNDSVYGQTLPIDDCLRYAAAIGAIDPSRVDGRSDDERGTTTASGYHWLETAGGAMLVDGGSVGPTHLPGHAHSDALNVLLWIDGEPVVTDTGTREYVGDDARRYARGVAGHNTARVGDIEPIALGGKYLLGPRPEPVTRYGTGDVSVFEGRYGAIPYRGPDYEHHRTIYAGDDWWLLDDSITNHGGLPVRSSLHLHPDVDASIEGDGRVRLDVADGTTAFVHPLEGARSGIVPGPYYPRFGETVERSVVQLHADDAGVDPVTVGCLLTSREFDRVAVETDRAGEPSYLHVDGTRHRLPERTLMW